MKKSLIYTIPVLLSTACSDPADRVQESAPCVYPGKDLEAYYELLTENSSIIAATDLCERPVSFQTELWDKVREAEKRGLPPTALLPQAYYDSGLGIKTKSLPSAAFPFDNGKHQKIEVIINGTEYDFSFPAREKDGQRRFVVTDQVLGRAVEMFIRSEENPIITIPATQQEAYEIYAAHLAHSLWLEKNEKVPWSILEYNQEQLEELLQPRAWFNGWDEAKQEYSFKYILDYSPRETFYIATEAVPSFSDQKTALVDIIKSVRRFRHGSKDAAGKTSDPEEIVTI